MNLVSRSAAVLLAASLSVTTSSVVAGSALAQQSRPSQTQTQQEESGTLGEFLTYMGSSQDDSTAQEGEATSSGSSDALDSASSQELPANVISSLLGLAAFVGLMNVLFSLINSGNYKTLLSPYIRL